MSAYFDDWLRNRELRFVWAITHWHAQRVDRRALATGYARWARAIGLVVSGHDARFEGELAGVPVVVDTGIRDSGVFDVVVRLVVRARTTPAIHRREAPGSFAPVFERRDVVSLRVAETGIELRFAPASCPEALEDAVSRTVALLRSTCGSGAYR